MRSEQGYIIKRIPSGNIDAMAKIVTGNSTSYFFIPRGNLIYSKLSGVFSMFNYVEFLYEERPGGLKVIYDYKDFYILPLKEIYQKDKLFLTFKIIKYYDQLREIENDCQHFNMLRILIDEIFFKRPDIKGLDMMFMINSLKLNGHFPIIERCCNCGKEQKVSLYFDIASGGSICQKCYSASVHIKVKPIFINLLRYCYNNFEEGFRKTHFKDEIFYYYDIIYRYFNYHSGLL